MGRVIYMCANLYKNLTSRVDVERMNNILLFLLSIEIRKV